MDDAHLMDVIQSGANLEEEAPDSAFAELVVLLGLGNAVHLTVTVQVSGQITFKVTYEVLTFLTVLHYEAQSRAINDE